MKDDNLMVKNKYRDQTVGIYLRSIVYEDTEQIVMWRNSDSVRCNFIVQEKLTNEIHINWIETMIETGKVIQMMICLEQGDVPVGSVYISNIDYCHRKAEYGIFIGEDTARGKGIGTATAKLMLRYCFTELQLHKVYLRAYADNQQAIGSYEKAGFVQEAYLKDEVYVNGRFRDMILMAVWNPADK